MRKRRICAIVLFLVLLFPRIAVSGSTEKEISLDDLNDNSINLESLNPLRLPGKSYDDRARKTIITGYAVTSYKYNDNGVGESGKGNETLFGQDPANTTDFAFNKISVGFTKRYSDLVWMSAAIEVATENEDGTVKTETELDVGEIHLVAPFGNGIDFALGKFNSPIGFELEDAPVLLQASNSLTFQFATPSKMIGLIATYPFMENLDFKAGVFNGWNRNAGEGDNNKGKSLFFQIGFAPVQWADLKFSYLWGPELDSNENDIRNVFDITGTLTPWRNWIFGFEFAYGYDEESSLLHPGIDAEFYSGQATIHHDFTRWFGTTFRYSFIKDDDGHPDIGNSPDEPDEAQERLWHEVTIAPVFHISPDFLGYLGFGVIPRTQHLLSGIDLRLEYRYDWIEEDDANAYFRDVDGSKLSFRNTFIAELVALF